MCVEAAGETDERLQLLEAVDVVSVFALHVVAIPAVDGGGDQRRSGLPVRITSEICFSEAQKLVQLSLASFGHLGRHVVGGEGVDEVAVA